MKYMRKNRAYSAVAFLAMLALLLPARFILAEEESDEARVENSEAEKQSAERERETDKQTTEQTREAAKQATEQVREAAKQAVEEERETEKQAQEQAGKDEDENEEEDEDEAEMRSSTVAKFVKKLLEVADKNKGGIGEEVRIVAREQEEEKERVFEAIEEVKSRSWLKTFLIGADYKNIGMIRSEIVKTQNRLDKLSGLLETMTTSTGATTTIEQIQNLAQAQTKLTDFLKVNESRFSLFGWFVKLFND